MAIDARPHPRVRLGAQRAVAAAMVAAAIVLSLGIGAPFEKDQEPQSAQWIQAVVQRGEWLLPRDDYGGIDRKPPLYYWLSALAVKAGGARVDEVSARFVALVAGVLLAVATMRWSAAFHRRGHRMARARVRAGHLRFRFARDARPHRHAALSSALRDVVVRLSAAGGGRLARRVDFRRRAAGTGDTDQGAGCDRADRFGRPHLLAAESGGRRSKCSGADGRG